MAATMPGSMAPGNHVHVSMGSTEISRNSRTGVTHLIINKDVSANIPLAVLFAIAEVFALITATMLGGALAKENDGHLEMAWTKPVTRDRFSPRNLQVSVIFFC